MSSQKSVGLFDPQKSLAKLPVPELKDTCARYLKSLEPILLPEQYANTEKIVKKFMSEEGDGPRLHKMLVEYAKTQDNWLERWWDKEGYYGGRYPITINTNPGMVLDDPPALSNVSSQRVQVWRTAQAIHSSMHFMFAVQNNKLTPDKNMCMSQYARLFAVSRVPQKQYDRLLAYMPKPAALPTTHFYTEYQTLPQIPTHVVVICNGLYFKVEALTPDAKDVRPLAEIEADLAGILKVAPSSQAPPIGALTGIDRDAWAEVRESMLQASPINGATLETIQQAQFVFVMDGASPSNEVDMAREAMMGRPQNRWFDKHMIIVFANGRAALNFEHGATDGLTLVRLADFVNAHPSGSAVPPAALPAPTALPKPLSWVLSPNLQKAVLSANASLLLHQNSVDLQATTFTDFGRDGIKQMKSSPDAFFQMAIQLGYYRLFGVCVPTYESAATRQYLHGRTETLRSCTSASRAFVQSMDMPGITSERKLELQRSLLRQALQTHSDNIRDATNGQGCDRHLLGLMMIAPAGTTNEMFSDPSLSYSRSWQLSTSSMPTNEVVAFGAVMDTGYGVYYCFPRNGKTVRFCVTSFHGHMRPAPLLAQHIVQAMRDMARVLHSEAKV